MNQTSLSSIIVPIYNAEITLSRMIESILSQSNGNFELILIDDGSTDNSSKICNKYASIDSRIKYIHKSNGGVSSARNIGLNYANGKFVFFIDSDDEINPSYLESMIKSDADICFSNVCTISGDRHFNELLILESNNESDIISFLNSNFDSTIVSSVWGKALKKDIIDSINLRFNPELESGEDQIFMLKYFLLGGIKKITNSADATYFYIKNSSDSLSKKNVPVKTSQIALKQIDQILINPDFSRLKKKLTKSHINNIRLTINHKLKERDYSGFFDEFSCLSFKVCLNAILSILF